MIAKISGFQNECVQVGSEKTRCKDNENNEKQNVSVKIKINSSVFTDRWLLPKHPEVCFDILHTYLSFMGSLLC